MLSGINRLLGRMTEGARESSWTLFRLLVAAMFMTHGYEKLLGENPQAPIGSGMTSLQIGELVNYPVPFDLNLLFVAGVIELGGGALILLGLWTHFAALLAFATMTMAYLTAHLAWFPTLNNGELAAMYWCAFLVLFTFGPGPHSLDALLAERRQDKRQKKIEENS